MQFAGVDDRLVSAIAHICLVLASRCVPALQRLDVARGLAVQRAVGRPRAARFQSSVSLRSWITGHDCISWRRALDELVLYNLQLFGDISRRHHRLRRITSIVLLLRRGLRPLERCNFLCRIME